MLWIISTVGKVQTRHKRALSPTKHRFKNYICNGKLRLCRRPIPITEQAVEQHSDELKELWQKGILEVRMNSLDGKLYTFGETVVTPAEVSPTIAPSTEDEFEEVDLEPPPKPLERMNKNELVEYAMKAVDAGYIEAERADIEDLTKAEIKKILEDL